MGVQRPSWVLNFKVKFDEAVVSSVEPEATSVDQSLQQPANTSGPDYAQPCFSQQGDDDVTFIMQRVPKAASMEKPGYRQAGQWSATFDFRDLPIDPRAISAASVEIHIGVVSDQDFARGMDKRNADRSLSSVLRTRTEAGTPNESTMQMLGTVDEWELTHDATGSIVEISGRDLRGILIDTPINVLPNVGAQLIESLDLSRPIDDVVVQILGFNKFFCGFQVVVNADDWEGGVVPAPAAKDLVPRHRRGARGNRKGGRGTPNSSTLGSKMSFWDLIVWFCNLVGGIAYLDALGRINIRAAATVYDKIRGPIDPVRNPTPFLGGQVRSTDAVTGQALTPALRSRRMVYGRDVESLNFYRKFGGWRRPKTVRAIGFDPDSGEKGLGKVIVGIWPPEGTHPRARKTKRASGRQSPLEEIVNIRAPAGIKDVGRLTTIAKAFFNEVGRGEVGGSISTKNLASFGGTGGTDPDLLRLSPGDGVELLVDVRSIRSGAPLISTLTDHDRLSFDDQVREITKRIGNEKLARIIVATARGQIGELQRFFRVQNVKFSWSDRGIEINFDYQNYIVVNAEEPATEVFDFSDEPLRVTANESFDFTNDPLAVTPNEAFNFSNEPLAVTGQATVTNVGSRVDEDPNKPTLRNRRG